MKKIMLLTALAILAALAPQVAEAGHGRKGYHSRDYDNNNRYRGSYMYDPCYQDVGLVQFGIAHMVPNCYGLQGRPSIQLNIGIGGGDGKARRQAEAAESQVDSLQRELDRRDAEEATRRLQEREERAERRHRAELDAQKEELSRLREEVQRLKQQTVTPPPAPVIPVSPQPALPPPAPAWCLVNKMPIPVEIDGVNLLPGGSYLTRSDPNGRILVPHRGEQVPAKIKPVGDMFWIMPPV